MKWVIILLFQFYNLLDLNVAQFPRSCGGNETLYSRNGTYDTNLNTLLSSLTGNIDSYGFYNTSRGENPDKVSIIAQCRGDVGLQTCRDCVSNAARDLPEACPYNKVATGYFDECVLRYSNDSIIGTVSSNPLIIVYTKVNASSPDEFMRDVRSLLESLRNEASRGGTKLKFASNNTDGPDFQTIYAFAQCTADLSPQDCFACLGNAYRTLPGCACYGKPSVNMLSPSCYFRYQLDPFLNEQPPPPPQAPPHFLPSSPPPPPPPPGKEFVTQSRQSVFSSSQVQKFLFNRSSVTRIETMRRRNMDSARPISSSLEEKNQKFDTSYLLDNASRWRASVFLFINETLLAHLHTDTSSFKKVV